jgi:seryl-tRNA synthetase
MLDFEQASKVSGTRFVYLKNQLAKLERAIANYMLDKHTNSYGYTEIIPPNMVRDAAVMELVNYLNFLKIYLKQILITG